MTDAVITDSGFNAHPLQVGKPSPLRMIARLAYPVSSHRFFAAHITDTSQVVHLLSGIYTDIQITRLEYHKIHVDCKFFSQQLEFILIPNPEVTRTEVCSSAIH